MVQSHSVGGVWFNHMQWVGCGSITPSGRGVISGQSHPVGGVWSLVNHTQWEGCGHWSVTPSGRGVVQPETS